MGTPHLPRPDAGCVHLFGMFHTKQALLKSPAVVPAHSVTTHGTKYSDTFGCCICKEGSFPTSAFERHVGRHLEELSLFLLRWTTSEDENEEDVQEARTDRIYRVGGSERSVPGTISKLYLRCNVHKRSPETPSNEMMRMVPMGTVRIKALSIM